MSQWISLFATELIMKSDLNMICGNHYKILSFSGKRKNKGGINLTFYGAHIQGVPRNMTVGV